MSDPDDTFMKLRMGELEARKERLNKRAQELYLNEDFTNFDEFREVNQGLLDVHAELIAILKEESAKIDEEIERRK
jgi:hypothetical protein